MEKNLGDANLLKPVFHSYPDIRKIAGEYRANCGLEEQIPVDVEKPADVILKINVIPIPSLYRSYEINAFISNDFKKIYVDEYLYVNLEPQYRFTLAHELGHMVLHKSFLSTIWDHRYRLLSSVCQQHN
ncbi:ImmA/IrrE family metallo-endopeptidase [bacterium]|nr:MAG: ImmA/IrrE family metallo-endopeptidase [bacterium]